MNTFTWTEDAVNQVINHWPTADSAKIATLIGNGCTAKDVQKIAKVIRKENPSLLPRKRVTSVDTQIVKDAIAHRV